MTFYEGGAATAVDRILAMVPNHPEILEMSSPFELFKLPGFDVADLELSMFQACWALGRAKQLARWSLPRSAAAVVTRYDETPEGRARLEELRRADAARSDRLRQLYLSSPHDLPLPALIELLRLRATAAEVPPCAVCGGPLSVSRAGGGGPTVYGCTGQEDDPDRPGYLRRQPSRTVADRHYSESRVTVYHDGDPWVLELLERLPKGT